jgi:hypothetical protein
MRLRAIGAAVSALACLACLAGCATDPIPSQTQPAASAQPTVQAATATATAPATAAKSTQSFGAKLEEATPFVALAEIVKAPAQWAGKRVRTRGEVVAVCQAAGCWADLKPEGDAKAPVPTHVSMHDHAFFLPKSVKTRSVEVEGVLATRALSKEECDHYNGEGASLTPGEPVVTIDALGVATR